MPKLPPAAWFPVFGMVAALAACSHARPAVPVPAVAADADVERLLPALTNRGRWGTGDQFGTLNHLTPERVRAAAGLVREGIRVSLARRVELATSPDVPEARYEMRRHEHGSRDYLGAVWHGFGQTHVDALCHVFAGGGEMYGGHKTDAVGPEGCRSLGIDRVADRGIVGRGVLLDVAALAGPLEPGTAIRAADLDAAARRQGIEVRAGDVLVVRTGARPANTRERRSGLHPECLTWVQRKGIAVLIGDGDNDVAPLPGFTRWASAFHSVGIPFLGLTLVDNAELDELATTCRRLGRWEFLIVIAPWRLAGATSSPVNPVAVF